jgi:delta24-sterol reductase
MTALQEFITRNRAMVIFLVVVPISFAYQTWQDLNNWIYRNFFNTNALHDKRVAEIQSMVKGAFKDGKKMCTARAPWKTMSIRKATYKDELAKIPINLRNILSINEENLTLRVEPMATMGDITHYLVPRGYALSVQVEMDDLTVGGLLMGIGIETSSHRLGFLFEMVKSFEIITAEGELIKCSRDINSDLFHALPMSHGTLGFLVAAEIEIVKVKKYMRLEYIPYHSMEEFSRDIKDFSEDLNAPGFIEGLIYSKDTAVIMLGDFADTPIDGKVNPVNRWYKPWFHSHAQKTLENGKMLEYIPIRHYFHRHTPSMFFQLKDLIPFANTTWYRWLFAWLGAPKISLMKFSMTPELRKRAMENRVAQDIVIPIDHLEESIEIAEQHYGIYPIWICPVRIYDHGDQEGLLRNPSNTKGADEWRMYVDVGIYGIPKGVATGDWKAFETSRMLEHFTRERDGFHMLYADIFMSKSEFEEMFSHGLYRKMRRQFHAEQAFPEVYDKVIPEKWLIDIDARLAETEVKFEQAEKAEPSQV